jgi:hypothetical protein
VTPHVTWTASDGRRQPDFTGFPETPYTIGADGDIWKQGDARLIEIPVTVLRPGTLPGVMGTQPIWFRPWYSDADTLCRLVRHLGEISDAPGEPRPLVMMFHNVEVIPGASPYPQSEDEVQRYLDMLAHAFRVARDVGAIPCTMAEYADHFVLRGEYRHPQSPPPLPVTLRLSTDAVDAAIDRHGAQPWFKYVLRERASRWDCWQPCHWVARHVSRAAPILSIGTGVGFNLLWLAEQGFTNLQGRDIDPVAVAAGRDIAMTAGLAVRLDVDDGLAPALPFDGPYAVIEALNWTHLVEGFDLTGLLDVYVPQLADGGAFILDTIDATYGLVAGNEYCTQDLHLPPAQRRPSEYRMRHSEGEVRAAFSRHGMSVVAVLSEPQAIPKKVYIARRPGTAGATDSCGDSSMPTAVGGRGARTDSRLRVLCIADVPKWIFERHARTLQDRLGDEFRIDVCFYGAAIREDDYDLIHPLEWNLTPFTQVRTPAKWVTGIRSHSSWAKYDRGSLGAVLRSKFAGVYAVSRRLERIFQPLVPGLAYLPHGVDTGFFTPSGDVSAAPGRIRVGWAGNRTTPSKGFSEFIEPLAQLPGVELVFCGYADRNLDRKAMRDFYDGIDVYVCASAYEGHNNPLMEAASMRRAIVTTDVGTVPEFLVNRQSALIVRRTPAALAAAVTELREDATLRCELGEAARDAVIREFDWSRWAPEYGRFMRRAVERAGVG